MIRIPQSSPAINREAAVSPAEVQSARVERPSLTAPRPTVTGRTQLCFGCGQWRVYVIDGACIGCLVGRRG